MPQGTFLRRQRWHTTHKRAPGDVVLPGPVLATAATLQSTAIALGVTAGLCQSLADKPSPHGSCFHHRTALGNEAEHRMWKQNPPEHKPSERAKPRSCPLPARTTGFRPVLGGGPRCVAARSTALPSVISSAAVRKIDEP